MRVCLLVCFLLPAIVPVSLIRAQSNLPPIGQWRDHLPYRTAISVQIGSERVYCATPFSFFTVNKSENSIDRWSRTNGLSETGISTLGYDPLTDKLLVAYTNSNLDLFYRNDIINIPDIKRSDIQADKTIYQIYADHNLFYLSSGLGIILVDPDRFEVRDTWVIGNGGAYVRVNGFTANTSFYYAATAEGLKRAPASNSNPSNFNNWELLSGVNGLPAGEVFSVVKFGNRILALTGNSIFEEGGGNWTAFYTPLTGNLTAMRVAENRLLLIEQEGGGARVRAIDTNGSLIETISNGISQPADVFFADNAYWVADRDRSLVRVSGASSSYFRPDSPDSVALGTLHVSDHVLYATAGSVNNQWQAESNKNGVYRFSETGWKNFNLRNFSVLDSVRDIITVAPDSRDGSFWAGSFGGGLLHISPSDAIEIFKQNSPLQPALGNPGSYRVSGLTFDKESNLWISNFGAAQNIAVRKADGTWKNFSPPFALTANAVADMVIDDFGQKWIVSPLGNGLICFNDNQTIDNIADDRWRLYRAGAGAGNLPSSGVQCVTVDKNGFIWVGTDDGIGVVQCPGQVFTTQGCEAVLPIVPQGNFAGFLFKGESVRSIAVDGADRKWVATANGVFLVSDNGEQLLYNFTEENSPLLSDDVRSIAIDGVTGYIFFATAKGICSFRGTATQGGIANSSVLVFPNPVPPGYQGTIAVRGLVSDAIVKITEMNGRLVYQGRAQGGQFTWDGKDYRGRRISTGVYLVLVSDDGRKEKAAARIVFISR